MNFDLNINNYSKSELVDMFELPKIYDRNLIEIKETQLIDNIINNKEINETTKLKTLEFIKKTKQILLKESNVNEDYLKEINVYNTDYKLKDIELEEANEHMIQIKKEQPYITSFPTEYLPGIINPIRKRTNKKILNIDTRFRENYYASSSSNFNITLPITLNNVLSMQLNTIELPVTFFGVSKNYGNNFFNITINGVSNVVIIPDGNYTYNTISQVINNALDLLGPNFAAIEFMINASNGTGSGRMMVGLDGSIPVINFELNFQADISGIEDKNTPLPLKLGWMLGFRNGIYINNSNYVSEGIVDVSGPRYFFLAIDDYNNSVNNNFFSAFNSSILNKNILAKICLQAQSFNILFENNLSLITTPREYFGPVNIKNINIQLLDEYGRVIDLNNMDYSFCLTFTTAYDI